MTATQPYTRLPGRSQPFFGALFALDLLLFFGQNSSAERMRLYEAPDHLLLVRQKFFLERAHRFYFSDIQAITVQPTHHAMQWSINLLFQLVIAVLPVLAAVRFPIPSVLLVISSFCSGLLVILLLLNLLLGPSCITTLYTATATQPLTNLSRLRTARKVLARITPKIHAAQASGGEAAPEGHPGPLLAAAYGATSAAAPAAEPPKPGVIRLLTVFFILLLVCGLFSFLNLYLESDLKDIVDNFIGLCALGTGCVSFGLLRGSSVSPAVRILNATGIGLIFVLYHISSAIIVAQEVLAMQEEFGRVFSFTQAPYFSAYTVISACFYLYVGLLGLGALWRYHRTAQVFLRNQPPPV